MAAWADGGDNDICPKGFSVPTKAELAADVWGIKDTATALSSFLKLTSTALPTSEPSKAALTLTVPTVLLVIVAV
jgi:hypothetical protein